MRKVRIVLPQAQKGMNVQTNQVQSPFFIDAKMFGDHSAVGVNNTLKPAPRELSNVEAERGETVFTNMEKDGIPEHYVVGGKPHSQGGTPLNLPNNSFVFSKDKSLKLSDQDILKLFNKRGKNSYVPAEIAKQYKINDFRKILADPTADKIQIDTAEKMIENYNLKLGALAMAQESMKGFPNGIPPIAIPYLENAGIDPASLFSPKGGTPAAGMSMKRGGLVKMQQGGTVKGLRPGEQARFNSATGQTEIINAQGKVVGYINTGSTGAPAGGNPSTTGKPTMVQNIPDGVVKWDETAQGYDETKIQPGDYIKKADGKWYLVDGYKAAPYTYNYQDPRLIGTGGDLQEPYGRLEQMVLDPNNTKLREDLIAKHKTNLANTKPNPKTGLTQEDIDKAAAMSDQEIINNFLEMQKQVFAVNASGIGGKGMDEADSWDKSRENYVNTVSTLGFQPLEPWQQAAFQSTYIGLNELANDPQHKELLSDFRMAQEGRDDENLSGLRTGSISQIDGWVGNTTIGQGAIYKPVLKDLNIREADYTEVPAPMTAPTLDAPVEEPAPNAPWWLQDIIKTSGSAADMARIKKYTPWQATPGVYLPEPTFFDPTRELAANAEQANIASQAAAVFAGPQALGARTSAIQGQAARNVADIMSRTNNLNVSTANQFEGMRAQIMNQDAINRSNLATQLFDKNVIANQQFDNAKNMAREQLRTSYIDAITNRWQTQALNELYPQYAVDPSVGGSLNFKKGRPIEPTSPNQTSLMDTFQEYKNQNPGVADDVLYKMAAADMGMPQAASPVGIDPSFFANYANMMP